MKQKYEIIAVSCAQRSVVMFKGKESWKLKTAMRYAKKVLQGKYRVNDTFFAVEIRKA